jgi:hypothetical protein
MKVIAESKPVVAMPFVHLGYLAASYVKPQGAALLMGSILAVAGIGMAFRLVTGRNRRGKTQTEVRIRKSGTGAIGIGVFLAGIGCAVLAWKTGGRYYPHGDMMTAINMQRILECIEVKPSNTPGEFTPRHDNPIRNLPQEAGEYDLAAAVQNPDEKHMFADGWNVPMKLKVVAAEAQQIGYVLMSAGEDREWNTPDDFTSLKYAERWRAQKKGSADPAEQQGGGYSPPAARSSEPTP